MAIRQPLVQVAGQFQQIQSSDILNNASIQQATINFGTNTQTEFNATTTVSDTNITATSKIVATLCAEATTDHSIDEVIISGVVVSAGNIVAGASFDLNGYCQEGTHGLYKINYEIKY